MRKYITILAMLTAPPMMAQLDNTVEVTNEVKPVVTDVKKVDVKTKAADTKVKHYTMEYAVQGQPLSHYVAEPLGDYTSDAVKNGNRKGYVHLSGGSHGNLDGQATYQFDLTQKDALAMDFALKGFNGKAMGNGQYGIADWMSRDYRNHAHLHYTHLLSDGSEFFAKGAFENHLFNYQPSLSTRMTDKQHDVLGSFSLGFTPNTSKQFSLGGSAGVDFFNQEHRTTFADKLSEVFIYADIAAAYSFNDEHGVGVGVGFNTSNYGNDELKGVTDLHFKPHYLYTSDLFTLQLGMFVNTEGNVAPDVAFTYHLNRNSDVYVSMRGYEEDNNLRRFSAIHPYFLLSPGKVDSEFHQVDARGGYRFNNHAGFAGDINAGFDMSEGAPYISGLYNAATGYLCPSIEVVDNQRAYLNVDLTYNYKDIVKVDAKNQVNVMRNRRTGSYWIGGSYITPRIQMLWTVDVRLTKGLYFGLDWRYGYYKNPYILSAGISRPYERMTMENLGASLRYTLPISTPITLFVKGDNLLNQNFDRYLGYRSIGANVLGGFALSL